MSQRYPEVCPRTQQTEQQDQKKNKWSEFIGRYSVCRCGARKSPSLCVGSLFSRWFTKHSLGRDSRLEMPGHHGLHISNRCLTDWIGFLREAFWSVGFRGVFAWLPIDTPSIGFYIVGAAIKRESGTPGPRVFVRNYNERAEWIHPIRRM